ncbi:MAG TPA: signal peptidase I [Streptosporangiaceae bacterium]
MTDEVNTPGEPPATQIRGSQGEASNGRPDGRAPADPGGAATDGPEAKTAAPAKKPQQKKKGGRSFWKELPILIVVALLLTLVIKTYAIQAFYIPSGSMQNTLGIGDRVLVNKLVYDFRGIHRGDIVVFSGDGTWDPGVPPPSNNFFARFGQSVESMFGFSQGQNDFIKRVIGLPGDKVACCDAQGRVTVNGAALNEKSYLYPGNPPSQTKFSVTVPANSLWVMGDHRDVSYDSRGHRYGFPGGGAIPESAVVGRAFIKIWPFSQVGILNIPSTFQQATLNKTAAGPAPGSSSSAALTSAATAKPASPVTSYALGFAGAVPLTLFQRKARRALIRRFRRR